LKWKKTEDQKIVPSMGTTPAKVKVGLLRKSGLTKKGKELVDREVGEGAHLATNKSKLSSGPPDTSHLKKTPGAGGKGKKKQGGGETAERRILRTSGVGGGVGEICR